MDERPVDSGAITAAERLRLKVDQSIIQTDRARLHITISLGVAEYQAEFNSPEMLLDHADKALYKAKQAGKNRVEISSRT